MIRKIETKMDPEHPENQKEDQTFGAEKLMADMTTEVEKSAP
jgi:hypothetical protein